MWIRCVLGMMVVTTALAAGEPPVFEDPATKKKETPAEGSGAKVQEQAFAISVRGLRVVSNAPTPPLLPKPLESVPGTTVVVMIHAPSGGMISVDKASSSIQRFTDDKKTDLTQGADPLGRGVVGSNLTTAVTEDGKYCQCEFFAPGVPHANAKQLELQARVVVVGASQKQEYTAADVALKDGSKIAAGDIELAIEETGKPDDSLEPLGLAFRAFQSMDRIAAIKFYKADGTEILSRRSAVSSTGVLGALSVKWQYRLVEKVDVATIKIQTWTDMKKIEIPVHISTGPGL